jgi:hypothetical protein
MGVQPTIGHIERSTCRMRSSHSLDRIRVVFDGPQLVADAGLLAPASLAAHLGLRELADRHIRLGRAAGAPHPGAKLLTLVASALAGGDCIDDADALRAGGTARVLGFPVKAPSTLGTFLRSFDPVHLPALERLGGDLLERAWAGGIGPGTAPVTLDVDSTICEVHGDKEGGTRGYTAVRGYDPILLTVAGTGEVVGARLREGAAHSVRGAPLFLAAAFARVRAAGATGPLTLRADSGFYAHDVVEVCRRSEVRFSITIRFSGAALHDRIAALPEAAWTPIAFPATGGADVAELPYVAFAAGAEPGIPVRLVVRRFRPAEGSQLALLTLWEYRAFVTDREGDAVALEADHRRHAEVENAIRDLKHGMGLNHLPSGRFAANAAWLAVTVIAHNLARWTVRLGRGPGILVHKTVRRRLLSIAGRLTRSGRCETLHLPSRWPWAQEFLAALARIRSLPLLA